MTAFLRYLISTSVVGAIALAAIDGKAVLAAPSPKAAAGSAARAAGSAARAIEEWEESSPIVREWKARAKEKIAKFFQHIFPHKRDALGAERMLEEKETHAARPQYAEQEAKAASLQRAKQEEAETARRLAEAQQDVSSLFKQAEPSINDELGATSLVVMTPEQIENIITKLAAKVAEAGANRRNPKFGFDASTGKLTFYKSWVVKGVKVTIGGINLYNVVKAVRGGKYVYNCIVVEKNGTEKCIKNILDRIDEYVATELNLQDAASVGPG
jgi:hypothetical protein